MEALQELYDLRHDETLYMSAAKQKVHDLERLLISELERVDEDCDAGWDAESIRRYFANRYHEAEG